MSDKQEQLWRNPAHWRWGLYRCREDARIIVPKRSGWGASLNFAHRSAFLVLAATLLAMIVPVTSAVRDGHAEDIPRALLLSLAAVIVIVLCARRVGRD